MAIETGYAPAGVGEAAGNQEREDLNEGFANLADAFRDREMPNLENLCLIFGGQEIAEADDFVPDLESGEARVRGRFLDDLLYRRPGFRDKDLDRIREWKVADVPITDANRPTKAALESETKRLRLYESAYQEAEKHLASKEIV